MNKHTVPDLKELFKQASEIAQQVPESMQEAAFNRAVDLLTGSTPSERESNKTANKQKRVQKGNLRKETKEEESSVGLLLSAIDSTQHPEVGLVSKILDRSLMILKIALTDHNVDGLIPSEIAKILTEKFRINTTSASISMAIGKATSLVNRIPKGQGFSYRIMEAGEQHLANLGEAKRPVAATTSRKKARKGQAAKSTKKEASTGEDGSKKKAQKTKQKKPAKSTGQNKPTLGGIGPKSAVLNLLESGYFSNGRTGPEVQTYLKNKRGFNFGIDRLRLVMLRLVRSEKLDRDENADGQYEYKTPKT